MNRTTSACYLMLASAFVLSALALLQASSLIENRAHAEMVVSKGTVTMVTTQFSGDSEILYVLDSSRSRLFAYVHDPSKRTIVLLDSVDISRAFAGGGGGDEKETRGGGRKPRGR